MKLRFLYLGIGMLLVVGCISRKEANSAVKSTKQILKELRRNMVSVKGGTFDMGCTSEQK